MICRKLHKNKNLKFTLRLKNDNLSFFVAILHPCTEYEVTILIAAVSSFNLNICVICKLHITN